LQRKLEQEQGDRPADLTSNRAEKPLR